MNKHSGLVYLAGPLTGMDGGIDGYAIAWRCEATNYLEEFGIKTISPTRNSEDTYNNSIIRLSYENTKHANIKSTGLNNLHDVRRSDLVLVNFLESEEVSIGTCTEIGMAMTLLKPIVLVCTIGSRYSQHPTINLLSYGPYSSLSDGLEMVLHVL